MKSRYFFKTNSDLMFVFHLFVMIFIPLIIITNAQASDTYTFHAIYGRNKQSTKPSMGLLKVSSRIQCGKMSTKFQGSGGFNTREVDGGKIECDFKQGISSMSFIEDQLGKTYYELEVQEPSFVSRDCKDLKDAGVRISGVYNINLDPDGSAPQLVQVYCDMETAGGGWTVLLKRQDGSVNFEQNWAEYKAGFGLVSGEFWLGLETMHRLTTNGKGYKLRIDMRTFDNFAGFAEYNNFEISSEADLYRITLADYTGDVSDSFTEHNGMAFSTPDVDNDVQDDYSCALRYRCGFWFKACSLVRLTGPYGENVTDDLEGTFIFKHGIMWYHWFNTYDVHPKYADMKIRP